MISGRLKRDFYQPGLYVGVTPGGLAAESRRRRTLKNRCSAPAPNISRKDVKICKDAKSGLHPPKSELQHCRFLSNP
jgi:hypothetical protein